MLAHPNLKWDKGDAQYTKWPAAKISFCSRRPIFGDSLCQPVLFGDYTVVTVDLHLIADLQRTLLCQNVAVVDLILMCKVDLVFILIREDEE